MDPLYNETDLRRVFDRGTGNTNSMTENDDRWEDEYLPEFQTALARRVGEV